jgi:hypothetical protein
MSIIHFDPDRVTLKKWAASTTSGPRGKSVVRIELETQDAYALASILQGLEEIEGDQRRAVAREKAAKRPAKPLMLPYHGGDR